MGIGERILNRVGYFKKGNIYYYDNEGKPKTIIATGKQAFKGISSSERTERTLKRYWEYYEGEGTIFASINTTAWNTVMVGFHLISENDDAKKLLQGYLDRLNVDDILLENVKYALIYGDSFIEKVKDNKDDVVELKTVDPTTVVINTDQYGRVESYQQKIKGELQKGILKPEDIIHIKFFPKPSSPYGISLIEPSKDTIDRKVMTDESLSNAIQRHGTSKYVVKIGTETDIPPKDVFNDIKRELEDITSTNEFIVPGVVDIDTIDEKGIQGVEEYSQMFQTQLIIGLLCPEEALGLGRGSTEATSKVKEIMYERMIRAFQMKLGNLLRNQLFNTILEKNRFDLNIVKLKFNSVTDADEAVKAKWLGNLLRGYYPEEGKPFTKNEVRTMFDFPEIAEEKLDEETPTEEPEEETPKEEPTKEPEEEEPKEPKKESSIELKKLNREVNKLKNRIRKIENEQE